MTISFVDEKQILNALHGLEPGRWPEVLDFIGYLQQRASPAPAQPAPLTARALLQSGLVGVWADRDDIGDSVTFARQLRQQVERRGLTNAVA
jgi:hypothetical protein